ncbi:unnamed protein product [Acanthoscelides obtectus]|uniref:CCHC-type domain-containing protein n=1 Tax=Acanthoscelides obtectus TaxID=200917 RepID=A0A9P0PVL8_ACAOB|nr:unnamed protein product [Acanthoscelides obtectus]CAK1651374.1 Nucleic-acid-binding protein from transposon X-element [Acanthoscelides obtectus]
MAGTGVPPINIEGTADWSSLSRMMNSKGIQFSKARTAGTSVKVFTNTPADYRQLVALLESIKRPFFTYQLKEDRMDQRVIRGLPREMSVNDIKEDLVTQGIADAEVQQMTSRTTKKPLPLFLVKTKMPEKLAEIQRLAMLTVSFERKKKSSEPSQCYRCQRYGHTQRNCRLAERFESGIRNMQKEVVENYPRFKKKEKETKTDRDFTHYEPERRMLFDRIQENLKMSERITHLHRLVYIGSHNTLCNLPGMFGSSISTVNGLSSTGELTGFLLVYNTYFIHVVEGSEDAINQHVGYFLKKYGAAKGIGEMKCLIQVSHVLRRLCKEWIVFYGIPPKLLNPLEEIYTMEETGRILYECLRQVYDLIQAYMKRNTDDPDSVNAEGSKDELESKMKITRESILSSGSSSRESSLSRMSSTVTRRLSKNHSPYFQYLPEAEVLQALLISPHTQHMKHFCDVYMTVPQREIYKDKVFPVTGDFIPFDVFSTTYNCVVELSK